MVTMPELEVWIDEYSAIATNRAQDGLNEAAKFVQSEEYAEAAGCFLAVLKTPNLPLPVGLYARFHGATCLVRALVAGQYDEQLWPTDMSALTQSNWVLDQAELLLQDFTRLAPDMNHAKVYLYLSTIQRMQARYRQALASLQEALHFAGDSVDIHFEYAQTCDILGLVEDARRHFGRAYDSDSQNAVIAQRYAMFLLNQGEVELAQAVLAQIQRQSGVVH